MSVTFDINELLVNIKEGQGDGTYIVSISDYDQIEFSTVSKSHGYYVSNELGGSVVQLGDTLEAHALGIYRTALATQLHVIRAQVNAYLGIWTDPQTDRVYYDVTRWFVSEQEAVTRSEQENQLAYYDIERGEAVNTPSKA